MYYRPGTIPSHPDQIYAHTGWQGYGHWLGIGNEQPGKRGDTQEFLPFNEAMLYARSLKLKTQTEWREWAKTSARPVNPKC